MISTTPSEKHKNLAAYKERRNQFVADKKLKGINSSITDEEIQEWQTDTIVKDGQPEKGARRT